MANGYLLMSRPKITITTKNGELAKTNGFLERMLNLAKLGKLDEYGKKGVKALSEATPVKTGTAANSWYYKIVRNDRHAKLIFCNDDVPENASISVAILLQYGHAGRNGIFVEGTDYINPALKPVFGEIAHWIIEEVKGS